MEKVLITSGGCGGGEVLITCSGGGKVVITSGGGGPV